MGNLRILGGEARGRLLKTLKDDFPTRPLLGRIKKSLFDILQLKIVDARFLDLYAGTGTVGIEALSRGARAVVFVDGDPCCVRLIKENVNMLGWSARVSVHQADILKGLGWLHEKFDVIYLGPPYKDSSKSPLYLTSPTLRLIMEAKLLSPDGWILSQHHAKEHVSVPAGLELFRKEKYGDTIVSFYRHTKTHDKPF